MALATIDSVADDYNMDLVVVHVDAFVVASCAGQHDRDDKNYRPYHRVHGHGMDDDLGWKMNKTDVNEWERAEGDYSLRLSRRVLEVTFHYVCLLYNYL